MPRHVFTCRKRLASPWPLTAVETVWRNFSVHGKMPAGEGGQRGPATSTWSGVAWIGIYAARRGGGGRQTDRLPACCGPWLCSPLGGGPRTALLVCFGPTI